MTGYPKRLIEVDLPIKRISAHARREKSVRHGHISTLHIWWARRPLAACRAVICAALWLDPADPLCPDSFREAARTWMRKWATYYLRLLGEESYERFVSFQKSPERLEDNEEMRRALLDFVADFSSWDNSTKQEYLETSRALTQAAHEALGGLPGTRPLVVDPFAGGGAIPLEALRVGADVFASDLNPIAVLLNKVVLEYIPKYGQRLSDEVRKWGAWIKEQAEKELAEFYPKDLDGSTPIAYLWARTIACEGPRCGAEVPLMRSLWLAKKGSRSVALKMIPNQQRKRVDFDIIQGATSRDVGNGTVRRGSAICPVCGYTTPVDSVRRQLKSRQGGATDARLVAVVATRIEQQGRFYRLPTEQDIDVVHRASEELQRRIREHKGPLSLVPDEQTPSSRGHRAVGSVVIYGMENWAHLFTPRQALALTTLASLVRTVGEVLACEYKNGLAAAVQTCLALALDRQADHTNSGCTWNPSGSKLQQLFKRQAIPMVWDFAEAQPFGDSVGDWLHAIECVLIALDNASHFSTCGYAEPASAISHSLPDDSSDAFITDPPYYDAVPYADLSDFFYTWLRRSLAMRHPELFQEKLTPKQEQVIVWHPGHIEETREFEQKMCNALAEGHRITRPHGLGVVIFAHKSTRGWEAQLQAMIDAGWTITASWPIDTELGTRMNAMGTASLASSIHLVCRPREKRDGAIPAKGIGEWRDMLAELPKRIHDWMPRLAAEGIVGADAIFACLGPALEIFSQYSRVEKASGEQVTLKEYLEHVWAAVAKEALNMIFEGADATGFEEDARLTAMWLWTLSTGTNGNRKKIDDTEGDEDDEGEETSDKTVRLSGYVLEYDAARKIAQGLGAHLEHLTNLVEIKGDKARLLPVSERANHLFGKDEGKAPIKRKRKNTQLTLFDVASEIEEGGGGWGEKSAPKLGDTVLDRIHQSMILFAAGRSEALKRFLVEDGVGRDQRFWRLAQALSALYPVNTDEKRWVDGVLARKKGLGF